jgi:hypothetical protein
MKTIPKDRQIIIEIYYGTYVAIWNEVDQEFKYANPQTDMYHGKYIDTYYETESVKEEEILSWRELSMETKKQSE